MNRQPIALANVRWRPPTEGRPNGPPPGPVYASTARFDDDTEEFSVVLRLLRPLPDGSPPGHEAELTLLAPDLLSTLWPKFAAGARLIVKEGRREVADCEIVSVREDRVDAGRR